MPTIDFDIAPGTDDSSAYFFGDATWPPNGGSFAHDAGAGSMSISKTDEGATYAQDWALMRWDTSSIPDTATITDATLRVWIGLINDTDNLSIVGDYYDFGGEPPVAGDWIETASPSIFTAQDISAFSSAALRTWTLTDLTGINKTGYTGIRLTLSTGTPTGANWVGIDTYESTSHEQPRLSVTYTAGGAGSGPGITDPDFRQFPKFSLRRAR